MDLRRTSTSELYLFLITGNVLTFSHLQSKGVSECGKETNTRFFFQSPGLTPLPPYLPNRVCFSMLTFSENFFYINNLLLSTALWGVRFTTRACPVARHEFTVHASGVGYCVVSGTSNSPIWVTNSESLFGCQTTKFPWPPPHWHFGHHRNPFS